MSNLDEFDLDPVVNVEDDSFIEPHSIVTPTILIKAIESIRKVIIVQQCLVLFVKGIIAALVQMLTIISANLEFLLLKINDRAVMIYKIIN